MNTKIFLNLTNGLEFIEHTNFDGFVRIQSTWLEQKRFEDVLWQLDNNFLMWAAVTRIIVIDGAREGHPQSRALWQGLPWIRYCLNRLWYCHRDEDNQAYVKDHNCTRYFSELYDALDKRIKTKLCYFQKFCDYCSVTISGKCFPAHDGDTDLHVRMWRNYVD